MGNNCTETAIIATKRMIRAIGILLLFALLTVLTQIGGLVYLLSLLLNRTWKTRFPVKLFLTFATLYLLSTFLFVPLLAPVFGREKVEHTASIRPATYLTVLLNRNYVRPELNRLLAQPANALEGTPIAIRYLDANFPFLDRFPLAPHLSHHDGRKIDLSFVYETEAGQITDRRKSVSGYGIFTGPEQGEPDQPATCREQGHRWYGSARYLTLGRINRDLHFSEKGTRQLIDALLKNRQLGKLFIEPHLKQRLGLTDPRVRYQGCWSVRHDDHLHLQL